MEVGGLEAVMYIGTLLDIYCDSNDFKSIALMDETC